MPKFQSEVKQIRSGYQFPDHSGVRIMMMPFDIKDIQGTIPDILNGKNLEAYKSLIQSLHDDLVENLNITYSPDKVIDAINAPFSSYLTIDEAYVEKGEYHRRPGLHVDGVDAQGNAGGWGGGGGGWGAGGMLVASSRKGCVGWDKLITGKPGPDGNCSHLAKQLDDDSKIVMEAGDGFFVSPLGVHTTIPQEESGERAFIRVSFPNNADWYSGYTENPLGVKPSGAIKAPRVKQMSHRSG